MRRPNLYCSFYKVYILKVFTTLVVPIKFHTPRDVIREARGILHTHLLGRSEFYCFRWRLIGSQYGVRL